LDTPCNQMEAAARSSKYTEAVNGDKIYMKYVYQTGEFVLRATPKSAFIPRITYSEPKHQSEELKRFMAQWEEYWNLPEVQNMAHLQVLDAVAP